MKPTRKNAREATQLFRACFVEGALDEARVREVVGELAASKPRGYQALLAAFQRLVRLEASRHLAKVESARPLSADLQAKLVQTLTAAYGAGVSASFTQNPALIGGLRIQVGSDVYDGSIRGRLEALQRSF